MGKDVNIYQKPKCFGKSWIIFMGKSEISLLFPKLDISKIKNLDAVEPLVF
jgi:hypothetical protein